MVKGITRQVVLVKSPDPRLFEEAIFIVKEEAAARELLSTTRMPIQQVALAVGYEGMSQFNAVFKRYYGMTPGQLRKMSETATPRPF